MRSGEKLIVGLIVAVVLFGVIRSLVHVTKKHDMEIPYYSTASNKLATAAMAVYHHNDCKDCHSLWTLKNMMESVPAPNLDGIGSIRTATWLYDYLSSENPQAILASRLKKKYRMPSYAGLAESDRRLLVKYLASLKVKDWYLEQTKKLEYEKLTGLVYKK
ncbi:MAG: c-type cytochrome [Gallionella sp.]